MNWQNLVFYINGYPIFKALKDLEAIRKLDAGEFAEYHKKSAFEIARHHYDTNPFYRSKLPGQFPQSWEELPIMSKTDYQKPLVSMISQQFSLKDLFISKTSGSSGHPMYFARDKYAHARNWAYVMDRYKRLNVPVGSKFAWFYGMPKEFLPRLKERFKDWLMNRFRFVVFDLSDSALESIAREFQSTSFQGIYGYTHSLVYFAKFLLKKNRVLKASCPSLQAVLVTSEVCTIEDRRVMEQAFGVPVKSEYGASEFGYIGEDIGHDRWRLAVENLLVEVVPVNSLSHGEFGGKILVTDLNNRAFPFIRFSIGDIGSLEYEVGYEVPGILTKLMGRTNDMAKLPSGKVVPGLVFYYVSKSIIEKAKGIKQYVIRQRAIDTFEFILEADSKLSEEVEKLIERDIIEYLESGLRIIYTYVESIDKMTNGKIKHFYSDVKL